jgi:AcrR family transcriptional regulator
VLEAPKLRRRRPFEERQAQIIDAAIPLFAERGYHQVSIQDIADEANVSVGLIYRIAGSKQELLLRSIDGILDAYEAVLPLALKDDGASAVERLLRGFRAYCEVIDGRRKQALLAYAESRVLDREGRQTIKRRELEVNSRFAAVIRDGIDDGVFSSKVAPDLAAYDLIMFGHMWALKYWAFSPKYSLSEYIDAQFENILASLARHPSND